MRGLFIAVLLCSLNLSDAFYFLPSPTPAPTGATPVHFSWGASDWGGNCPASQTGTVSPGTGFTTAASCSDRNGAGYSTACALTNSGKSIQAYFSGYAGGSGPMKGNIAAYPGCSVVVDTAGPTPTPSAGLGECCFITPSPTPAPTPPPTPLPTPFPTCSTTLTGPSSCPAEKLTSGGFAGGTCSGAWDFQCPCGYFPMHLVVDTSAYLAGHGWSADCTTETIHFYCCDPACENCHDPVVSSAGGTTTAARKLTTASICLDSTTTSTEYSCSIESTGSLNRHEKSASTSALATSTDFSSASSSAATSATIAGCAVFGIVGMAGFAMYQRKKTQRDEFDTMYAIMEAEPTNSL